MADLGHEPTVDPPEQAGWTCPVCEATVGLDDAERLREHRDRRFDGLGKCPASGKTIAEANELIAGRRGEAR